MTEQTEVITWKKYPEKVPESDGLYLVNLLDDWLSCDVWRYDGDRIWTGDEGYCYFPGEEDGRSDDIVIAWAELPKGWQEE